MLQFCKMAKKISKIFAHNGDYKILFQDQSSDIPIINSKKQVYEAKYKKRRKIIYLLVIPILVILAIIFNFFW